MADAPPYKALSYTWGNSSDPRHKVILNGDFFEVRENLWAAIKQLADTGEPVNIWIDAICIDQENVTERSHQVGMMRAIYGRANQVICWLGPADEKSKLAFRLARFIRGYCHLNETIIDYFNHFEDDLLLSLFSFASLCQRPYWSRIWIIQEISLPDTVIICCGNDSIEWDDFFALSDLIDIDGKNDLIKLLHTLGRNNANSFIDKVSNTLLLHEWRKDFKSSRIRLYQCLLHHYYRHSTDRDKIFGLAGLDSGAYQIEIDYSLSVAQIYTDIATKEIATSHRLDILTRVTHLETDGNRDLELSLPSWVPDWSLDYSDHSFLQEINRSGPQVYTASKENAADFCFTPGSSELIFKGFQIDSIKSLGTCTEMGSGNDYPRAVVTIQSWWNLLRRTSADHNISTSSQIAFSRTLLVDRMEDDKLGVWNRSSFFLALLGRIADLSLEHHPHRAVNPILIEQRIVPEDAGRFDNIFDLVCQNIPRRRFCIGAVGTLCLVPRVAEEGDIVCLPLGCSHPIVLRPREDHYIVLGEAYADGWMYGKAIDEMEEGKLMLQDFEVR